MRGNARIAGDGESVPVERPSPTSRHNRPCEAWPDISRWKHRAAASTQRLFTTRSWLGQAAASWPRCVNTACLGRVAHTGARERRSKIVRLFSICTVGQWPRCPCPRVTGSPRLARWREIQRRREFHFYFL